MKLKIYLEQRAWQASTAVWIVGEDANGKRFAVEPVDMVFKPIDPMAGIQQQPSLVFMNQMSADFFGAFHDAIVESGYKPKDTGIEALKYHLEDMRSIAFAFLPPIPTLSSEVEK